MALRSALYHGLSGNDTPPDQVGVTRGVIMAALAGVVNVVLMFMPMTDSDKVTVMVSLNPTLMLLSYVIFGLWEKSIGSKGEE